MFYDLKCFSSILTNGQPDGVIRTPLSTLHSEYFIQKNPLRKKNFLDFYPESFGCSMKFAWPSTYQREEFLKPAVKVQCT